MKHRSPRTIHTDYLAGRDKVVKHTRSSTLVRAIQHALQHLIQGDYPEATKVVIWAGSNGRELAFIKRTIGGWIVRT